MDENEELDDKESLSEEKCMSSKNFLNLFLRLGFDEFVDWLCVVFFGLFFVFFRSCRLMVGEDLSVRSGDVGSCGMRTVGDRILVAYWN